MRATLHPIAAMGSGPRTVASAQRRAKSPGAPGFALPNGVAIIVALAIALAASAVLTAYALGTGQNAWLGCLSLVPLFSAIRWLLPAAAGLSGAFWGASLFVSCLAGLGPSIESSLWSPVLLVAAPGVYCALGAALTRWIGFSPFVLGVGWMAVELALVPVGLHSGLLSGTQEQTALMDYLGRALGHVLVAFVVAYVNAILLSGLARVCAAMTTRRSFSIGHVAMRLFPECFSHASRFIMPALQPRPPPHRRSPVPVFIAI